MIYYPIDVNSPITTNKQLTVQSGTTNNFPEIVFELHDGKMYFDLGDDCVVSAAVTNTDQETVSFTGEISILNPHRGQILCQPVFKDFSMTGINVLTVLCDLGNKQISFQTTIFVQSLSENLKSYL